MASDSVGVPVGLEFRVLGPVEARRDGERLPLGGPKPRALLAMLVLRHGRVVSVDTLVDTIWPDDPPETAPALIQTYVSALRRGLGAGVIETRAPGYVIGVGEVDVVAFDELVARGRREADRGEYVAAAAAFRSALELWQGDEALGGIGAGLRAEANRLGEVRMAVLEERVTAELAAGEHLRLVGELTGLVGRHPLREHLRGLLMTAMHRSGMQADALAVYAEGRRLLADELGVDPGPELRALHADILGAAQIPAGAPVPAAPAQLPPDTADFTGRRREVAELRAGLSTSAPVPVVVVSGKGGVGKTTLAVHVAHQLTKDFPDGQLFADLRGFGDAPAVPEEVLDRFLRALGVRFDRLPADLDGRIDLYRTVLADQRILVVLDNAGAEAQVRPLLPASRRCGVLVTSRSRLPGLGGTTLVELNVFESAEAAALLTRIVGPERVRVESTAATQIVTLCGGLALALRTVAARLVTRRHWSLGTLARRLADERRRLDELAAGDLAVRASLAVSYQALDPLAQRAFRRLGLFGLPDFSSWVVGALLDLPVAEAEDVLDRLFDAQLVDVVSIGPNGVRYRLHDLIRLYALELAEAVEPDRERTAAARRLAGGWVWLFDKIESAVPAGVPTAGPIGDVSWPVGAEVLLADPVAWLEAETAGIAAVIERIAAAGLDTAAVSLAMAVSGHQYAIARRFELWSRIHDAALAAARARGNRLGEAWIRIGLGTLRCAQDRYDEAAAFFEQAQPVFSGAGRTRGAALARCGLGTTRMEQGRLAEAQLHLDEALRQFQDLGDDAGVGHVSWMIGTIQLGLGNPEAALSSLDRSMAAHGRLGSVRGCALALRTTSLVHRAMGDYERAAGLAEEALARLREHGDPLMIAYGVQSLAKARLRLGRRTEVAADLDAALEICRTRGDRWGQALMRRTLGELHLAEGRHADAEREFGAANVIWTDLGLPLWRARTLRDLASVLAARGEPDRAAELTAEAAAITAEAGC